LFSQSLSLFIESVSGFNFSSQPDIISPKPARTTHPNPEFVVWVGSIAAYGNISSFEGIGELKQLLTLTLTIDYVYTVNYVLIDAHLFMLPLNSIKGSIH
jgi:hypothetical protein